MQKFRSVSVDHKGQKKCGYCGRVFSFEDVLWDGVDIEYNNETLWIDSICSKKCSINCEKKNAHEELSFTIEDILYRNGVPKLYLGCSFDNFKIETQNHTRAVEYLKSSTLPFKRSILLVGNCGTGKTHLAIATMRNIILKMNSTTPLFISAPKLIGEIRRGTLGEIELTEEEIISKYTTERLLIIDDIGVEKHSEFVAQCWYRVVDSRTSNNLPTIYTSNLDKNDISLKMGPRIASRLFSCTIIPIDGDDKRENRV
jgi:DNA replication protein DnaC